MKKIKREVQSKTFSNELASAFKQRTITIQEEDIERSINAMQCLSEYIRFCYYDDYICRNSTQLKKYCKLLLRYEQCNQKSLMKYCEKIANKIINEAKDNEYNLKTIDLSLNFQNSTNTTTCLNANQLMDFVLGSRVNGTYNK